MWDNFDLPAQFRVAEIGGLPPPLSTEVKIRAKGMDGQWGEFSSDPDPSCFLGKCKIPEIATILYVPNLLVSSDVSLI